MKINFVGKNIELTPALKEITTEKFMTLTKHSQQITKVNVVFQVEHNMQVAEANILLNGTKINATAKNHILYDAIDDLVAKLLTQMIKQKEKLLDKNRSQS